MLINGVNFTIGADPEILIEKEGRPASAHNLVKGTKQAPHYVENGAVQVDGMALEFNIDPVDNEQDFLRNLNSVQKQLLSMIEDKGYSFLEKPSVIFDKEVMKEQPFEALELGCEPDFDAYTGKVNDKPDGSGLMRTAGGHIHIGWTEGVDPMDEDHFMACRILAASMDKHVGIYSLFWDTDIDRRSMYGKAGCFRPKSYGMEYRSLSNAWIHSEKLQRKVYNKTEVAVSKAFTEDSHYLTYYKDIINTSNIDKLRELGYKDD